MTTPTTIAELTASRDIVAAGPSGKTYRLRPVNFSRRLLEGELSAQLLQSAMNGSGDADPAMITERGHEIREANDQLVRLLIVEPDLADVDLDLLPPVDYDWACAIARGDYDRDGEGRRLWGKEPLSVWGTFRDQHGCGEDCERCARARASVADLQRGPDRAVAGV